MTQYRKRLRVKHPHKVIKNLIKGEAPPTAPMPIIERLAGTPYRGSYRNTVSQDRQVREILELSLDLAEVMLRYGGGALEVEATFIAVVTTFGLKDIDMDITNQSVIVNYAPKDSAPITLLRVARSWSKNFCGLSKVHVLVTEIVAGKVSLEEAKVSLSEIENSPKPFASWVVTFSSGTIAAAVIILLGGGLLASMIGFVTCTFNGFVAKILGRRKLPNFFITCFGSALATSVAILAYLIHTPVSPSLIIAGGIIALLPAARLVSAVQDAIQGFPVTASGRLLSVMITVGALVSGLSIGIIIGDMFKVHNLEVVNHGNSDIDLWLRFFMIALIVGSVSINEQSSRRHVIPAIFVGFLGYTFFILAQFAGFGERIAPAFGAIVVGVSARILANKMNLPSFVLAIPAVVPFLPGLLIFTSTYQITVGGSDALNGVLGIVSAVAVAIGLAAGVVFGDYLGRPFERYVASIDESQAHRR